MNFIKKISGVLVVADFIVLDANPAKNIKNTQKIFSVYKAGKKIK